jgi:broad specificity phosphatase PhoE
MIVAFLQRPTSTSRGVASLMIIRRQQQTLASSSFSSSFSLRLSSSDSSSPSDNSSSTSSSSFRNHLLPVVDLTKDDNGGLLRNRFFALRHGQSLANVAGLIASNPDIACKNYGLSDVGKKQAEEAGKTLIDAYLNAQQIQPTTTSTETEISEDSSSQSPAGIVIVSSDLLRAKETAQIVADTIKLYNDNNINEREDCRPVRIPLLVHNDSDENNDVSTSSVTIDIRLRERGFGDWDGGNDIHYNDVWKEDAIDPYHTKNNVESVWSVIDRSTRCVIDLDNQKSENLVHLKNDDSNKENDNQHGYYWIICVAHGDVLQILQTAFNKNIDPSQHRSIQHLETATLRSLL